MRSLFLFNGGMYKRGVDSGRLRVPLTTEEAELVFADPELPGNHLDNTISTELNMKKYASELCNLAVGDELFVGLIPDASVIRGLWMLSFDALPGFTVTADLVSVKDVWAAYEANDGDATGVPRAYAAVSGLLSYDFTNGLGHSTKDATALAALYGGVYTDYRNNDALVASRYVTPQVTLLGESMYIRLIVTATPSEPLSDTGCCSACNEDNVPTFQVGAWYDQLCADKQRVRKYCNCPRALCGGCDTPFVGVDNSTAPSVVVNAVLTDDFTEGTIALTVVFDQPVVGFDETDVTIDVLGTAATAAANFTSIVVNSASSYTINYDANYGDGNGDVITFSVAASVATGVVGGLDNTASNDDDVAIPLVGS